MLFTTSQMEKLHGFEQGAIELKCKDKTPKEFRLHGITIDKNLNCKKRINDTRKNCCATLSVVGKIKRSKPLQVRK